MQKSFLQKIVICSVFFFYSRCFHCMLAALVYSSKQWHADMSPSTMSDRNDSPSTSWFKHMVETPLVLFYGGLTTTLVPTENTPAHTTVSPESLIELFRMTQRIYLLAHASSGDGRPVLLHPAHFFHDVCLIWRRSFLNCRLFRNIRAQSITIVFDRHASP